MLFSPCNCGNFSDMSLWHIASSRYSRRFVLVEMKPRSLAAPLHNAYECSYDIDITEIKTEVASLSQIHTMKATHMLNQHVS